MFIKVVDFSEAERLGFISALTEYWQTQPGYHGSTQELKDSATKLLRGCWEHYRAGVTRVSRISAAVPIEYKEGFVQHVNNLLEAPDSKEFNRRADLICRDFPNLTSWMNWWRRPSHASMLFSSERKMDIDIWNSIPETTNAEEAMHWKLYAACGKNHILLKGLWSLYAVAAYYERKYKAALGEPKKYFKIMYHYSLF